MSRTTEVKASADAWVQQDAPGKHHPRTSRLRVGGLASAARRTFIHFGRPFPIGGSVISATLQLYSKDGSAGSHLLSVYRVQDQWSERHLNWTNQPSTVGTAATTTLSSLADTDLIEVDVTPIFNDVAVGGAYAGLRLSMSDAVNRSFFGSEHPLHRFRPLLIVQWAEKPEPPRDGSPSGGNAVASPTPILDYRFGVKGSDPDQRQDAVNVQVSTSTDFTAPAYDSGFVTDDRTMFDLTGRYTVPASSMRWWRARGRDLDGGISDWSDKWQFQYVALPTLTLVNPSSGSPVVHDLTPPISWTYPGQAQFEVLLFRKRGDGTWKRIWHLPRHASTVTSVNVPAGKIKSGQTYLVKVRAWDGVARQSLAGSPKYAEVSQQFTYTRDGTPAAVSRLTGAPYGPGIALTWTDATQPDYYSIRVNGVEVIPRIEPADVLISGTNYGYLYLRGKHGDPQTIEVERVVNSAGNLFHSGSNPTVTETPSVLGKWLCDDDPASPLAMQIMGREQSNWDIGESGESLNPLNWRKTVRIIDAVRGFEGGVSGTLGADDTADDFLDLKGRNKRLRYIAQHVNVPVELAESGLSPNAEASGQWVASFNMFQQGEFFDVVGLDDSDDDD